MAIDLSPIAAAQADLLSAAAALLTLGIAVWGAMKVARMFGVKGDDVAVSAPAVSAPETRTIIVNGKTVTYEVEPSLDWDDGMDETYSLEAQARQDEKDREYHNATAFK